MYQISKVYGIRLKGNEHWKLEYEKIYQLYEERKIQDTILQIYQIYINENMDEI